MSIPAQGRVTLKDNQALVVLNVATNNNQAEERPRSDLEALVNRALRQEVPVYTQPGSHSSANTWRRWSATSRRGFHLDPVGLHGAWNAAAEQRLLECLTKPKRVVTPKPVVPAIAAPAPVLQLEDGKVSDSSSTSDSSYSDSSSSTSSEEEAMPEYVPNPSLPPPPEYPSDDEYGMPNPSLGPQSEVLTMTSTWHPQLQPPPAKRAMNVQPSASGARNGKKSFGLWLNPTSSLRNC
ncbi:unnamed protein product [Cladocopium goreaui]|uniref:Uncharacterized protein n=1 Tax=Cladocopium goreaui TaxID=2562237 RepID=A0A9P1FKN3_9DINO|nr:unnamed protein product [Cladocopium goreaui]